MTTMTENGVAYSPAKLPNLTAMVHPIVRYDHTANRTSKTILDLSITIKIGVKEIKGSGSHKIMNATSRFTFESDDKLTLDELYKAWEKSFGNTYRAFLKLLLTAGLPRMNIMFDSKKELETVIKPILYMFNDTEYVQNYKD